MGGSEEIDAENVQDFLDLLDFPRPPEITEEQLNLFRGPVQRPTEEQLFPERWRVGETDAQYAARNAHHGDIDGDVTSGFVFRSTHRDSAIGCGWSPGAHSETQFYTSRSGHVHDTTGPPPQPCLNCGGPHWRKDCPRRRR